MKKPSPTPAPNTEQSPNFVQRSQPLDPILAQHCVNLSTLSKELDSLSQLSDRWSQLSAELESTEAALESTAAGLLTGQSDDAAFTQESDRVAALEARKRVLRKLAGAQGTTLQGHLEKDIIACERLCEAWLAHRLQIEVTSILELIAPEKRGLLREPAFVLGEASIAYNASKNQLPPAAPVSYAWSRPLHGQTEKNLSGLGLVKDPLWHGVDMMEIVGHLCNAAKIQVSRWSAVISAVEQEDFQMPSYEAPPVQEWRPSAAEAGIVSGPPTTGVAIKEQPRIRYTWEPEELAHPPWEKQAS